MLNILYIAIAGSLGALARYGLSGIVQSKRGVFPWGTLAVNLLGALAFGFVWKMTENRIQIDARVRIAILVGFMGSFTTFSSFAFETYKMIQDDQWFLAGANVFAQNCFGILCLIIGIMIGKAVAA